MGGESRVNQNHLQGFSWMQHKKAQRLELVRRESRLTAAVRLCDLFGTKFLTNIAKPFDSLAGLKQFSPSARPRKKAP